MIAFRARGHAVASRPRRIAGRLSLLIVALVGAATVGLALLATSAPAHAATADTVAARDRDEDIRPERFLPPLAALVGGLGMVWAARRGEKRLAYRFAAGGAILATLLALGPLVMIGPRPLNRQPSPDAQEYADATRHLAAGEGFVTTIYGGQVRPPRYPPGFAAALAPFALVGSYPANVQLGSKVYAMAYIVATLTAGWIVGGPLAAAIAVALVGSSPFAVRFASLVMSDAFAAAVIVLSLALVHRPTTPRLIAAGLLSGASSLVRLSGVLTVEAILPSVSWRARAVVLAASLVGVVALAAYQWSTFGDPLMTGYRYWLPNTRSFGLDYPLDPDSQRDGSGVVADSLDGLLLRWACPCPDDDPLTLFPSIVFYPLVLFGMFWIFTPPLTTIPGLIEVWRRQRESGPGFALWLTLLTILFYLIYFYMGARFLAGPATLLAIYSGVAVARWVERFAGHSLAPASMAEPAPNPAPVAVPPATPAAEPAAARRSLGLAAELRASRVGPIGRLSRVDLAILALLTILSAFPRLTNLLGLDPFVDEASWVDWTVHQFDPLVPRSWFAPLLVDGRPPLHFWLSLPIAAVVDNGFLAGRLAAALAGIASTLALYGLGRELTGSRTAGGVAAMLWALTPFSVFFARIAADDCLLALMAILVAWSSVVLARRPSRSSGICCGLAVGLGIMAKTTGVLFVLGPPLAVLLVGRPREWRSYVKPVLAAAVAGLVSILPLVFWLPQVVAQVLVHTPTPPAGGSGNSLLAQNSQMVVEWFQLLLGLGLPALAAVGLVMALVLRQRALLLVTLLGAFWLAAILYRTSPLFTRYLLFASFPAYLLAGYAVERAAALIRRDPKLAPAGPALAWGMATMRAGLILASLAIALGPRLGLLRDVVFDPGHAAIPEGEHYRYVEQWYALHGLGQVADELRRRGREKVVTVLVPPASREDRVLVPHSALRSYLRNDPTVEFVEVPALFRAQDLRDVRRIAQNKPTFLLIDGTYDDLPGTATDATSYTKRIEERLAKDLPNAKEVLRIPRPSAPNWLSLYRLDRGD